MSNPTTSTTTPAGSSATDLPERYALGLLSGTSLDGVDAACCRVTPPADGDPRGYDVEILSFVTTEYSRSFRERLERVCDPATGTVDEITRLHVALGELFAAAGADALSRAGIAPETLDVVGSHGQTIWHIADPEPLPGDAGRSRSTLQIGDGSVIADRLETVTASDFRTRDVAAGGHGAPLAPFLDWIALTHDERFRAVQNIGGIGNCTFLPPNADREQVRAFDTGPGNMVIDGVVSLLTDGARTYDRDGELAAAGTVSEPLLEAFLADPYFEAPPPKTTGREAFGRDYAERFLEAGRDRGLTDEDIVASATALTARSIADAYDRFAPGTPDEVIVSGGGAANPTLMGMLRAALDAPVRPLGAYGIDGDAKEAALFALLGATRLDAVPNTVPAATGAEAPVVMGKLTLP